MPTEEAKLLTQAPYRDFEKTNFNHVSTFFAPAFPADDREAGRLLIINKGENEAGYLRCTSCQYAEAAPRESLYNPAHVVESRHDRPRDGESCYSKTLAFPEQLAHVFETDIRAFAFTVPIPQNSASGDHSPNYPVQFVRTLAEAMRLAVVELLGTDARDIRAVFDISSESVRIIMSDNVAGGAGYVRRLCQEPAFAMSKILDKTKAVLDCSANCQVSCSQCLNSYSNQTYWDDFRRLDVFVWLDDLMGSKVFRPSHINNTAIQKIGMPDSSLKNHATGAYRIGLVAPFFVGGSERNSMLNAMRSLRNTCEENKNINLDLYLSERPTKNENLSTLDRESIQIFKLLSQQSSVNVHLLPDEFDFEIHPRIWIEREKNISLWYSVAGSPPLNSEIFTGAMFFDEITGSNRPDWLVELQEVSKICADPFEQEKGGVTAWHLSPGKARPFDEIFKLPEGMKLKLDIEDPYIANSDKNAMSCMALMKKLNTTNIVFEELNILISTKYGQPSYVDQAKRLKNSLIRSGVKVGKLNIKSRPSKLGHFHDRILRAHHVGDNNTKLTFRWDITAGIDNLMHPQKQCSVFRTSYK